MADWKFGRLGSFSRVFLAPEGAGAGAEDGSGAEGGTVNKENTTAQHNPACAKTQQKCAESLSKLSF